MVNKIILIGRAGKDAIVQTTDRGSKVLKFTMATWVYVKDSSHETGWRTVTEWHNIVCWSEFADSIAQNVKQGAMVYVEGSVRNRSYTDKDGNEKFITEVVGMVKPMPVPKQKVEAPKPEVGNPPPDVQAQKQADLANKTDYDDLPY